MPAIFKDTCKKETTDTCLTVEEHKRKCVFLNPERCPLTLIHVDGCQITEGARCDYLVLDHLRNEYFIELKGKDLPHAVEQLEASIRQLSSVNAKVKKSAYIVASRHPSNDTSIQRAKAAFKKKYQVELMSKNTLIKTTIKK